MSLFAVLIALAIVCGIWAAASAVLITADLDRRGMKTPFLFMRPLVFRNLGRYKEATMKETGKIGSLFYSYVVSINAALVLALAALALRVFRS
jgi:hypothetical protein